MPRPSLITYVGLPMESGGAHVLRGRDIAKHWAVALRFLRECTDFVEPREVQIRLDRGPDVPQEFSASIIRELTAQFGEPRTPPAFAGTLEAEALWWHPSFDAVPAVVSWLKSKQPLPGHPYGSPLSLGVEAARLRLWEPGTRNVLPHQGSEHYVLQTLGDEGLIGESLLFLRLGTQSSLLVILSLPFDSPDDRFLAQVAYLQDRLPFRFSPRHWSRWKLNKAGTHYRGIRLRFDPGGNA